jgi:hypothetical protein
MCSTVWQGEIRFVEIVVCYYIFDFQKQQAGGDADDGSGFGGGDQTAVGVKGGRRRRRQNDSVPIVDELMKNIETMVTKKKGVRRSEEKYENEKPGDYLTKHVYQMIPMVWLLLLS